MIPILLVAHIVVLGYWLGSELVINSTFRYVSYADTLSFAERSRLMDHVMHVDQHVRYALVLQATLGFLLALGYGFVPGGQPLMFLVAIIGVAWLLYVELVHRLRGRPVGERLAAIDRGSRYLLIVLFLALAAGALGEDWPMPLWLRWKLGLFAGVIGCGVGIRLALVAYFRAWTALREERELDSANRNLVLHYWRATSVLWLLWVFIAAIVYVSVTKPV